MKSERSKLLISMGYVMKGYLVFPAIFGTIILILTIILYFLNETAALIATGVFAVYVVTLLIFYTINNKNLERGLVRFAKEYGGLEGEMIGDFPMPYVVTAPDGKILAYNKLFGRMYDEKGGTDNICDILHELEESDLKFDEEMKNISIVYDARDYRLCIKHLTVTRDLIEGKIVLLPEHSMTICVIYMFDETEIINMVRKGKEEQLVIGEVSIDNYDEVIGRNMDLQNYGQSAKLDQVIGTYFNTVGGVVRKMERDRYFVIFKRKYLPMMQRNKFEILDQIRNLDMGDDKVITVSVGIGVGEEYEQAEKACRNSLELALGRGGDQVVLKEGERLYFYGGKTKHVEKNTRVKARVKAMAIRDVLVAKDSVVIMGHKNADLDSFAASIGMYKAARALGKSANIVINEHSNAISKVLSIFMNDDEYKRGVFITPEQALEYVDKNTALVIVDVNKPEIFECPDLVQNTATVVLIDHHLQSGEKIDNLVLSYVESTSSSASEMVTEILQYISETVSLKKIEAEALYGGIVIDTDSFTRNTGARTFEAAAYLRKLGVDIQNVRNMFRDSLETMKIKAIAMSSAEEIIPGYVVAVAPSEGLSNPTIVVAQLANELLDVQKVKASFAMTYYNGKTYISARSIGDTNVQLVMEKMGGGGHLNKAGCQLETTAEEAKKALILTLGKMLEDNDLV